MLVQKRGKSMGMNSKEEFDKQNAFGSGDANTAFAEYFIGNEWLEAVDHVYK